MQNLRPIPADFLDLFSKTEIGKSLAEDGYELVQNGDAYNLIPFTPRERFMKKVFSVDPFYYINFLLEKNPTTIYDIGCGSNVWKAFYKNIVGIDPEHESADIKDSFDDNFVRCNQECYESIIAINSLHFIKVSKFKSTLEQVLSILKPGGRAYITFNFVRMIECTFDNDRAMVNKLKSDAYFDNNTEHLRTELLKLNCTFLSVEIDFTKYGIDACLDGNIRLVIEKHGI